MRLLRGAARRREAQPYRLVVQGAEPAVMAADLDAWRAGESPSTATAGHAVEGRLAFVFSGNGSQWADMGRDAYAHSPAFRAAIDSVDEHLAPHLGWSVAERIAGEPDATALRRTDVAQPLLFAIQVGLVSALADQGVAPDACIGHSVGEVAAAWAAGALSLEQACQVIAVRSRLQQTRHGSGGMAVLGLPPEPAAAFIAEIKPALQFAAINAPGSVTVAGPAEALDRLGVAAREAGVVYARLDLDYAFHSAAMEPLRIPLHEALAGLTSAEPRLPLVSTVTGEIIEGAALDPDYWWRNVREPVLFARGVETLIADGVRLFLEVGPQPALQSFLRAGLKQQDTAGAVLASLTPEPVDADPFPAIAARCHVAGRSVAEGARFDGPAAVRALPRYPWRRQRYWVGATSEAVDILSPAEDHPLLGFRRDQSRQAWVNHLSTSRMPWLAEHRVDGSVVLPAAAMIEMALAAARVRMPDAPVLELRDLEIHRPLLLDEARSRCSASRPAAAPSSSPAVHAWRRRRTPSTPAAG